MITSPSNARLKLIRRLASKQQRRRLGLFVCEGEDLVAAALDAGIQPVEALVDAERSVLTDRLPDFDPVAPALLAEVSALAHAARVVAVFRRDDLQALDSDTAPAAGLSLWRVADPGNLGTLLRTADALGPAFVALSGGSADPTSTKALRASMGSVFRVPLGRFEDAPRPWIALTPRAGADLATSELPQRVTFVLGAERDGLPDDVVDRCDAAVSIPLTEGAESLNVAVAGAIALYELRRRRAAA